MTYIVYYIGRFGKSVGFGCGTSKLKPVFVSEHWIECKKGKKAILGD